MHKFTYEIFINKRTKTVKFSKNLLTYQYKKKQLEKAYLSAYTQIGMYCAFLVFVRCKTR